MIVERLKEVFRANAERVILQKFYMYEDRASRVINRVLSLSDDSVSETLNQVFVEFNKRHRNLKENFLDNYDKYSHLVPSTSELSEDRRLLIGAYFSKEYAIEAAAIFNPSIVPHPDQSGIEKGEFRFLLSFRATGEGHISSVEFREGIISKNNEIFITPTTRYVCAAEKVDRQFSKDEIISECVKNNYYADDVINNLPGEFNASYYIDFRFNKSADLLDFAHHKNCIEFIDDYIDSNYDVNFKKEIPISERVLFPLSKSESMGIEDVRFVKFVHDDQSIKYYGTYTAYNGVTFRTQLIETTDFEKFQIRTMTGAAIHNKGMALFPRKVNGFYYMLGRQDGEHIYIMRSKDLYQWNEYEKIMEPNENWEFIQLGNCGSPLETDKGWLVLTHAVGALRKYVISAILLDKNNPAKLIGRLTEPILSPTEDEREGYVPNVVYSCGSLIHNNELIIPYAKSDAASGFGKIDLKTLLSNLLNEEEY